MAENPSHFTREGARRPVESVTWHDAQVFCDALCKAIRGPVRLPTEAEWEYACRAGTTTRYWFGDDPSKLADHAWFSDNSGEETGLVGAEGHKNPWGLYDVHGNVWEWCADWSAEDYYARSPKDDPSGPNVGAGRVLRGGCWILNPRYCRSAARGRNGPDGRGLNVGFRVLLSSGVD